MAQPVLTVVGSVVGAYVGMPWLGAAIGSAVGGMIDNSMKPPVEGPRLGDMAVSAATYGLPIPRAWGVVRMAGNMLWSGGIQESKRTTGSKAKGARVTQYSYSASFAMGFCRGEADRVLRLWFDQKLVYDRTNAGEAKQEEGLAFRFYPGDETQEPDATIVTDKGDDAPAHRGLCYIVFVDLPLEKYGNRIPNITAEIAMAATHTDVVRSTTNLTTAEGNPYASPFYNDGVVDWRTRRLYRSAWDGTSSSHGISVVDLATMRETRVATAAEITPFGQSPPTFLQLQAVSADGETLFATAGGTNSRPLVSIDADSLRITQIFGAESSAVDPGSVDGTAPTLLPAAARMTAFQTVTDNPQSTDPIRDWLLLVPVLSVGIRLVAADVVTHVVWGAANTGAGARAAEPAFRFSSTSVIAIAGEQRPGETDLWLFNGPPNSGPSPGGAEWDLWRAVVSHAANGNGNEAVGIVASLVRTFTAADLALAGATDFAIEGAEYDRLDDGLIFHAASGNGSALSVAKWSSADDLVWVTATDVRAWPHGTGNITSSRYGYGFGNAWRVLDTRTGDLVYSAAAASAIAIFNQAWDGLSESIVTGQFQRVWLDLATGAAAPLADVVADLCDGAGMVADEYDASGLTGDVPGFAIGQTSARDALQKLAVAYNFDGPETGEAVTFKHRGGASVATLAYDDLVRPGRDQPALPAPRRQEAELPASLAVQYRNSEQDQQAGTARWARPRAPVALVGATGETVIDLSTLVMTPDQAKAVARRLLMAQWVERQSYDPVALTAARLALEPADVVMLTLRDGSAVRTRIDRLDVGADFSLRGRLVAEEGVVHTLTATADGGSGAPAQSVPGPYATRLMLANLPLLADGDDSGGTVLRGYLAAGGYAGQAWQGAAVYGSADATTWDLQATLQTGMAWGTVVGAPAAPASAWVTDRASEMRVWMSSGGDRLESCTERQMLDGANAAALIGADGSVEILQFRDVTAESDGSYTLTTLLRGRRGTEAACAGRATGDLFVLLEADAVRAVALPTSALGATRYARAVGRSDSFDGAPIKALTPNGAAELPYAPVRLAGSRDGSGNLTLSWLRRTRVGGEWSVATETVALGESAEGYEVDVLDGATVVRTLSGLTAASASYSAADQAADFGTAQASVAVRVYQISATVGRGRAAAATI